MRGQPYGARPSISHGPPPEEGAPAGLFSKLKNMFSGDDSKPDTSFVPRRGPPTGGPPGYGSQFQKPPGSGQIPGGPPGSDPYARRGSPVGGQPQQPIPPGYPGYDRPPPGYGDGPGSQLPPGLDSDPFRPQQQQGMPLGYSSPDQYQSLPPQQQQQQGGGYDASRSGYGQQPGFFPPAGPEAGLYGQEPMIVAEPEPIIPPEPQLFTVDESVILILKPKEFHRKKTAILRAGSGSVQVFSDFEHVFTKFKQDNGEPTYSTAEVVESSPALLPGAITQIQAINQEVQNLSLDLEEAMARCQSIIAREGGLNTMSIPIITK